MPGFDAKAIIDGDAAQLTRLLAQLAQIMSVPESTLRSRFIADFFIALAPLHHHDAIRENFSCLENAIASQAADLEQIAMNMAHPLNTSVDIWLTQGLRWYSADSRSSQAFVAKFGELLSSIAACAASSGKQWTSVQSGLDALSGWQANEERRALLSEARLAYDLAVAQAQAKTYYEQNRPEESLQTLKRAQTQLLKNQPSDRYTNR